ncbi:MAG: TolC family protein [Treponema sp.]|jgi:outer membrane protein TolC|nr:TolC family protein [Treponema sp.]
MNMSTRLYYGFFLFSLARLLWADPFPDGMRFADAADLAVGNSPDLKNEYAQNRIRERAWTLGRRAYFPSLTFTVDENDSLSLVSTDSFQKSYSARIEQPVFDGGKLAQSRRVTRAYIASQDAAVKRMELEVADKAISAYRQTLYTRSALAIKERGFETLVEQREILSLEIELGRALPTDMAEADLKIADARIELISLEIDLKQAERQFAESLGLDKLPILAETIDIHRSAVLPSARAIQSIAFERNVELVAARFSIAQKQEELAIAKRSWIPVVKLSGSFSISGQAYPVTRYNWSIGVTIDFSSPFFSNTSKGVFGSEYSSIYTAQAHNSLTLAPDPASAMDIRAAEMALNLEKTKYAAALERAGKTAVYALEKCGLIESKRHIAVEALELAKKRLALSELRFNLGQITRIDIINVQIECTQQEVAAVQAAVALLEAERELERSMDLRAGELRELGYDL